MTNQSETNREQEEFEQAFERARQEWTYSGASDEEESALRLGFERAWMVQAERLKQAEQQFAALEQDWMEAEKLAALLEAEIEADIQSGCGLCRLKFPAVRVKGCAPDPWYWWEHSEGKRCNSTGIRERRYQRLNPVEGKEQEDSTNNGIAKVSVNGGSNKERRDEIRVLRLSCYRRGGR